MEIQKKSLKSPHTRNSKHHIWHLSDSGFHVSMMMAILDFNENKTNHYILCKESSNEHSHQE